MACRTWLGWGLPVRTLAFVERLEQVEAILKLVRDAPGTEIVALTPHVEHALARRGIRFARPEEAHDPRALEDLGDANYARVEALCEIADACLQQEIPYFGRHRLRLAWWLFFYLKILFDSVTLRLFELDALVRPERADRVLFFETAESDCDERMFWLEESVYARVIRTLAASRGVAHESLPAVPVRDPADDPWRRSEGRSRRWPGGVRAWPWARPLRLIARLLRDSHDWRVLLPRLRGAANDVKGLAFCSASYGLSSVIATLLRDGRLPIWLWEEWAAPVALNGPSPLRRAAATADDQTDKELTRDCERAWSILAAHAPFRALFIQDGLDWFAIASRRLHLLSTAGVVRLVRTHRRVAAQMNDMDVRAVVLATTVGLWAKTVAETARAAGIPVVVVPHGEIGTHQVRIQYYNDLVSADWYCVAGEGVARHVNGNYPQATRSVVVGSPMLDALANRAPSREALCRRFGLDPRRRIVLYNLTCLDGSFRYLTWRQPSDSRQYEIHQRIVGLFGACPDLQFVVKPHPARGSRASPIEDQIHESGPANAMVLAEPPFDSLIHLADAFVIDCPSTSLLQMCATDTPIYVFTEWFRWDPEALEALRKRAFVSADLDEFCRVLSGDLASGACFERRLTDRSFWRMYAVPEDGRAADNVCRFLSSLGAA